MIRIRKPHDKLIDRMLKTGMVEVPTGVGLYISRLRRDLEGVADIRPKTSGIFEIRRGPDIMRKIGETCKHSEYERTKKKWRDIL